MNLEPLQFSEVAEVLKTLKSECTHLKHLLAVRACSKRVSETQKKITLIHKILSHKNKT